MPGKGTHRNEVVLTWLQDAEEEWEEEGSKPSFWGVPVCTCAVSDMCG